MKKRVGILLFVFFLTACASEQTFEEYISPLEEDTEALEQAFSEEEIPETIIEEGVIEEEEEIPEAIIEEVVIEEEEEERLSFEQVWQDRIDAAMAPSYCFPVEGLAFEGDSYEGKLIDTHYHIANIPDSEDEDEEHDKPLLGVDITIADSICTLEQEGTSKVFAFFPIYPEIPEESIEVVRRTMNAYPEHFVPFIMPPENDDDPGGYSTVDAETLEDMLAVYPGLFQGYGEIGLYEREGGAKELPPDSKRLEKIYSVIEENQLVVYFHLGEGHKNNLEKAAQEHPEIHFIFHGDQLSREDIEDLLENNPNVYYTVDELYGDVFLLRPEVSKKEFLAHFEDYESLLRRDLGTWKQVIARHPNQFLWGTDRSDQVLWSHDPEVGLALAKYARLFIAGLDPEVQEKFAYKNAESLLS